MILLLSLTCITLFLALIGTMILCKVVSNALAKEAWENIRLKSELELAHWNLRTLRDSDPVNKLINKMEQGL